MEKLVRGGWDSQDAQTKVAWKKSQQRKAGLGFGDQNRAVALEVPSILEPTEYLHPYECFTIELDDENDTATIYLDEVDLKTGAIRVGRRSAPFPLAFLASLASRREASAAELQEMNKDQEAEED
ncbi:hypothetical protein [Methylorubrum extorquens]|uniref:hypothetical protein n=1 Tax=Methylorubrum extorquens TaxID=408 RepID=UPI001300E324|nr:hypothetical protein [Methylorubrum extorquens]